MLEFGSPALNLIPPAAALVPASLTDQRGVSRPQSGFWIRAAPGAAGDPYDLAGPADLPVSSGGSSTPQRLDQQRG